MLKILLMSEDLSLGKLLFLHAIFLTQLTKYNSVLKPTLVPVGPSHDLPLLEALGLGQNL